MNPEQPRFPGYRIHSSFKVADLSTFVFRQLVRPSPWSAIYMLSLLVLVVGMFYYGRYHTLATEEVNKGVLYGFLGVFPLILVHEGIHAITYKAVGAPRVGFGASWKSMAVYAYADGFVVHWRPFIRVAVMPFLVLTAAMALALPLVPPLWVWALLTALAIHTTACLGDFGLVNYLYLNRHEDLSTVDDIPNLHVYFLQQERQR